MRGKLCFPFMNLLLQVHHRILFHTVHVYFKVQVDACRSVNTPGIAHEGDGLATGHSVSFCNIDFLVVCIERLDATTMVDLDDIAIPSVPSVIGSSNRTRFRSKNRTTSTVLHVDSEVRSPEILREEAVAWILENSVTRLNREIFDFREADGRPSGWNLNRRLSGLLHRCGNRDDGFSIRNNKLLSREQIAASDLILPRNGSGIASVEFGDHLKILTTFHRMKNAIDRKDQKLLAWFHLITFLQTVRPSNGVRFQEVHFGNTSDTLSRLHGVEDALTESTSGALLGKSGCFHEKSVLRKQEAVRTFIDCLWTREDGLRRVHGHEERYKENSSAEDADSNGEPRVGG